MAEARDHDHDDMGGDGHHGEGHGPSNGPSQGPSQGPSHGHGHRYGHGPGGKGDGLVAAAVLTNLTLTAAQIVGGLIAGSVALIADALHNLSDAVALVLAFAARRIARRPATPAMSFGFARVELIAALVNYVALALICLWLGAAAVERLWSPPPVQGGIVILLALLAIAINGITALLTWRLSKESLNIRAAFLHNLSDAGTSVAVVISGLLVWAWDWRLADPLITIAISAWILWHALVEVGPVIRILMLGAPPGVADADLRAAIRAEEGVADLHHVHLWQLDEKRIALEAHVTLRPGADHGATRGRVKKMLGERFSVTHVMIETESAGEACGAPDCRTDELH